MRVPQKNEPIELVYNPKLTGENTLGQQKSKEAGDEDSESMQDGAGDEFD